MKSQSRWERVLIVLAFIEILRQDFPLTKRVLEQTDLWLPLLKDYITRRMIPYGNLRKILKSNWGFEILAYIIWTKKKTLLSFINKAQISVIIVGDSSFIHKQTTNCRIRRSLKLYGKNINYACFHWELNSRPPAY